MPSVLPTAAGTAAAAANVTVQGETFAAALAQLQAAFTTPNANVTTPVTTDAAELPTLTVFGITPKAPVDLAEPQPASGLLESASLLAQGDASPLVQSDIAMPIPTDGSAALIQMSTTQGLELPTEVSIAANQSVPQSNPTGAQTKHAPDNAAVVAQITLRGSFGEHGAVVSPVEGQQQPPSKTPEVAAALVAIPSTPTPANAKSLATPKRVAPDQAAQNKSHQADAPSVAKPADTIQPAAPQQQAVPSPTAPQIQPPAGDASTPSQPQPIGAAAPPPVLPSLIEAQQLSAVVVAAPQAGIPLDALAVHIARKFEAGANQFEIRLHPAELGQLDISLTVADDGHVQAVLRAERPETLDILQRDARTLEQQLRQAGLEVGSNALSFSLSGGNGQRHAPFTGWPGFADAQGTSAPKEDAAVAARYLAVRMRDGIDIRV